MTLRNILLLALYCSTGFIYCDEYQNQHGPEYGETWIMFVDDNGTTHSLNFSTLPSDTRGLIFGDAYFHLYTRQNNDREELTIPDNGKLTSNFFNPCNDIRILTHGWLSSEASEWLQKIKESLLIKGDYNVIIVDWSEMSKNPIYPWSAFSTRYVGKRVAKLLGALHESYDIKDRNVHLIGHSLGAQVMGYAGMFSKKRVHRITGLDPARPLFEVPWMGKNFRLEKGDALFVDIIHSCGGIYGYRHSHGDADFYPNEGYPRQPGCEGGQDMIEACSHGRACEFFDESINSKVPFTAYPCENWDKFEKGECKSNATQMGYNASPDSRGNYYLYTRAEPSYAIED